MPSSKDKSETPVSPVPSFEKGLEELEGIVRELERGELPLEDSISLFEKGMRLSEECRKQLDEAETKVEILMKKRGGMQPEPFDATAGSQKPASESNDEDLPF